MTTPLNQGDGASFFQSQTINPDGANLLSGQLDASQPQVEGLTPVSDPLTVDRRVIDRLGHFDPNLFDLRDTSHLMRLLKALLGAAGIGGIRKQTLLRRIEAGSISGSNFLDLDGFWGALFGVSRTADEVLPQNGDPSQLVLTRDDWDSIANKDAKYRSRITQFARAVNQGATYSGLMAAAEAILGVEVDLIESWVKADRVPPGAPVSAINANSWLAVRSKYTTYANMRGVPWSLLRGGETNPGQIPLGNRGELVIRPKRSISQEDKWHLTRDLSKLKPVGIVLTVLETGQDVQVPVTPRSAWSDSENWDIISLVTPLNGLQVTDLESVYPTANEYENGRPAFSQYQGEGWTYNSQVSSVTSYRMADDKITVVGDYQTVTYLDGQVHQYLPADAVMSTQQTAATRAASEGIMTNYPYAQASS